jgi:hypothetical protein
MVKISPGRWIRPWYVKSVYCRKWLVGVTPTPPSSEKASGILPVLSVIDVIDVRTNSAGKAPAIIETRRAVAQPG